VKRGAIAAAALAVLVGLSGCSAAGEDELVAQAKADFDALVESASAVDVAVLHTLEVEEPAAEPCDSEPDSEKEHTVFVAAGTFAIQATEAQEDELLTSFAPLFDDEERWTEISDDLPSTQRAYVDVDGITAAVTVDEGLLALTVFSPCR